MSFNGRVARIEQELRRRGRIKTPVVYFNDPEADLDEYRLPDWVRTSFARSSLDGRGASAASLKARRIGSSGSPAEPSGIRSLGEG